VIPIRKILLAALLGCSLLAGCSGTPKNGTKLYRSWCNTESRYLGEWTSERSITESQIKKHKDVFPYHATRINQRTVP
jgi:hypothetical protein